MTDGNRLVGRMEDIYGLSRRTKKSVRKRLGQFCTRNDIARRRAGSCLSRWHRAWLCLRFGARRAGPWWLVALDYTERGRMHWKDCFSVVCLEVRVRVRVFCEPNLWSREAGDGQRAPATIFMRAMERRRRKGNFMLLFCQIHEGAHWHLTF